MSARPQFHIAVVIYGPLSFAAEPCTQASIREVTGGMQAGVPE